MKEGIVSGFSSIFSAKLGVAIIGLITTPIIARLLGSSAYGELAAIMAIYNILLIFAEGGLVDSVRKFIAEDRNIRNWDNYVFSFHVRVGVIIITVFAILFFFLAFGLDIDHILLSEYPIFVFSMLLLQLFSSIARNGLMGLRLEDYSEFIHLSKKLIYASTVLLLLFLGYGIQGVLLSHILASLLAVSFAFYLLSKQINYRFILKRTSNKLPIRDMISFGIGDLILVSLIYSLYNVDIIMIQVFLDDRVTGHYRAALDIAEFMWFVPMALQIVLVQSTSELWSNDNISKINSISSKVMRFNIFISATAIAGVYSLSDSFIPLYFGSGFKGAIDLTIYLLVGVLAFSIARPLIGFGQASGKLRVLILATFLSAVINLILNLILIPAYGALGAAAATSAGYSSMLIFHSIGARLIGYRPFKYVPIVKTLIILPIVILLIHYIDGIITSDVASLLIVPPVGFIISLALSLSVGLIHSDEIYFFTNKLKMVL